MSSSRARSGSTIGAFALTVALKTHAAPDRDSIADASQDDRSTASAGRGRGPRSCPIVTGIAALCLLALGVGLEVPTTQALGTAALVMTASLLTPIEPLDGGFVANGPAGVAAGLALLGTAVFLLLGLG